MPDPIDVLLGVMSGVDFAVADDRVKPLRIELVPAQLLLPTLGPSITFHLLGCEKSHTSGHYQKPHRQALSVVPLLLTVDGFAVPGYNERTPGRTGRW